MAGDWLKVGKDTPDKPEMAILARLLGLSLGDTFLVFFRAFAWADAITSNGRVPFLSLDEAAELARCRPDFVPILSRSCPGSVPILSLNIPRNGTSRGRMDTPNRQRLGQWVRVH